MKKLLFVFYFKMFCLLSLFLWSSPHFASPEKTSYNSIDNLYYSDGVYISVANYQWKEILPIDSLQTKPLPKYSGHLIGYAFYPYKVDLIYLKETAFIDPGLSKKELIYPFHTFF